jgi:hypothetical protein
VPQREEGSYLEEGGRRKRKEEGGRKKGGRRRGRNDEEGRIKGCRIRNPKDSTVGGVVVRGVASLSCHTHSITGQHRGQHTTYLPILHIWFRNGKYNTRHYIDQTRQYTHGRHGRHGSTAGPFYRLCLCSVSVLSVLSVLSSPVPNTPHGILHI